MGQLSDVQAGLTDGDATHDVAHDEQHSELIHGSKLLYPLMQVLWVQAVVSQTDDDGHGQARQTTR